MKSCTHDVLCSLSHVFSSRKDEAKVTSITCDEEMINSFVTFVECVECCYQQNQNEFPTPATSSNKVLVLKWCDLLGCKELKDEFIFLLFNKSTSLHNQRCDYEDVKKFAPHLLTAEGIRNEIQSLLNKLDLSRAKNSNDDCDKKFNTNDIVFVWWINSNNWPFNRWY